MPRAAPTSREASRPVRRSSQAVRNPKPPRSGPGSQGKARPTDPPALTNAERLPVSRIRLRRQALGEQHVVLLKFDVVISYRIDWKLDYRFIVDEIFLRGSTRRRKTAHDRATGTDRGAAGSDRTRRRKHAPETPRWVPALPAAGDGAMTDPRHASFAQRNEFSTRSADREPPDRPGRRSEWRCGSQRRNR